MDIKINADLLKENVQARSDFLNKGFYSKVYDELNKLILKNNNKFNILDSGCGTGYCDNRLFEYLKKNNINPNISGFDISQASVDFAKKQYPHINFFQSDVNDIKKISNNSKDIILALLTPKNYKEYNRILKDDGKLYIIKYDVKEHFKEILEYVGAKREKKATVTKILDENDFKILSRKEVKYQIKLDNESLRNIIKTIPEHLTFDKIKVEELNKMKELNLTLSFVINEAVKKNFFCNHFQSNNQNRSGCIIVSKKNPRNLAVAYNKYEKNLFFPKGHIEKEETAEYTAKREIEEEIGLKVKIVKQLKEFESINIYDTEKTPFKITFFLADALHDETNEDIKIENHIALLWIDYEEVLNLDLQDTYRQFYLDNFKEIDGYIKWKMKNLKH